MTKKCPDLVQYDNIDQLPDHHPLRLHLEDCPRCRALLKARLVFEAKPEFSDEEDMCSPDAEEKMSNFLAEALSLTDEPVTTGEASLPPEPSMWARLMALVAGDNQPRRFVPAFVGTSAALILVAIMFLPGQTDRAVFDKTTPEGTPMRGGDDLHQGFSRPQAQTHDNGDLVLQWDAYSGAESYQILFWSELLKVVDAIPVGTETSARFGDQQATVPGEAVFFCVVALAKQQEIGRSEMVALR